MGGPEELDYDVELLAARARDLAVPGVRSILGITGAPGSGKSTLAGQIADRLGPGLVRLVPMDGFHLAGSMLAEQGKADRKGAPDTFDDAGYAAMLVRLRRGELVFAPEFRRSIEEPIAAAIRVPADIPLVITEGNYLLLGEGSWPAARDCMDVVWHLELPDDVRHRRLIARHERFGKSPAAAKEWTFGSDEANARRVEAVAGSADAIVRMPA